VRRIDIDESAERYFQSASHAWAARVDRMFIWLLCAEWLGLMGAAAIISPRAWSGQTSAIHPHLLAAIVAGPGFILPVVTIALLYPARAFTRHAIAAAQMVISALLIDCTGGRIESHFQIFGSLAFLACYRDWRVLITASALTAADHFARGIWWPQSVYGNLTVSPWRWVEHSWWVAFEDFFLLISMRAGVQQARLIARSQASLFLGASHDVLTGTGNRRLLRQRFDEIAEASRSVKSTSALLFIDLDRFKQANDTLGHLIGDRLLVLVAERLAAVIGPSDTLARVGGDEFVALIQSVSGAEEAESVGKRFLEAAGEPFRFDSHELLLSASIGIAIFPGHGDTLATLQEKADRAMYMAKRMGRNQCVVFSPEVARREEMTREIAVDLSGAMSRDEFELCYQPLFHREGKLAGFEALMRWRHPKHGIVSPADFIPLAEVSWLIVSLGEWALEEACRTCQTWQRPGHIPLGIAVNVSALQFERDDYADRVLATVARAGLSPSLLTLELTEGILVRDADRARQQLIRLRREGIRIALDDFGTGYSSLSYLTDLPADFIKLDRSFLTRDLPNSLPVIESIVALAHRLNLEVIAEGVETRAQVEALTALKCDQFQGYFFSRPIGAAEVQSLIESESTVRTGLAALAKALAPSELMQPA